MGRNALHNIPANALQNVHVLVTRPLAQAEALCVELAQYGAVGIPLPLIATEPVPPVAPWLDRIAGYDWITFTSANAVVYAWPHLAPHLDHDHANVPNIAAVGPGTAEAVAAHGQRVERIAPTHIAESLADVLGDVAGQRILWPRAAEARDVLPRLLRERGAQVDEVIVYRTVPAPLPDDALTRIQQADVIAFASPSAVKRFAECFDVTLAKRVVCIGPVTADAARTYALRVDAVATSHSTRGLLETLTHLYA